MKRCNVQITTEDGRITVTMGSGRTVKLHRCSLREGHDTGHGWASR